MLDSFPISDIDKLVDTENCLVSRSVFMDRAIYDQELEKIFGRCWLYLGHESQLKSPNDFFTTYMGEDSVLVTRDAGGKIHAFLNTCRHRGMRLCRVDEGNGKNFQCPYHGWVYKTDGALQSAPFYDQEINMAEWGLTEVAQLDTCGGMIFATWDPSAPSLKEYLGGMAFYLELMANRMPGGLEVLGGVQRWTISTNWKYPAENFSGDGPHVPATHASAIEAGWRKPDSYKTKQVKPPRNHKLVFDNAHTFSGGEDPAQSGGALLGPYAAYIDELRAKLKTEQPGDMWLLTPLGVGTVFPNLSFVDGARFKTFRLWQPRGPSETEVFSWCIVDAGASEEVKMDGKRQAMMAFGATGIFELDDAEMWAETSHGMHGWRARRDGPLNYQLGHKTEPKFIAARDYFQADVPGDVLSGMGINDHGMQKFYGEWKKYMTR